MLNRIGEYGQSLGIYEEVLSEYPKQAKVWMSYGHALKTDGQQDREHRRVSQVHRPVARTSARPAGASPT